MASLERGGRGEKGETGERKRTTDTYAVNYISLGWVRGGGGGTV